MGARPQHATRYRQMCRLLRGWREGAGLTQRALSALLRKPHSYVHKVETGGRRIDPVEFIDWCRACDVPPPDAIDRVSSARR